MTPTDLTYEPCYLSQKVGKTDIEEQLSPKTRSSIGENMQATTASVRNKITSINWETKKKDTKEKKNEKKKANWQLSLERSRPWCWTDRISLDWIKPDQSQDRFRICCSLIGRCVCLGVVSVVCVRIRLVGRVQ